MDLTKRLSDEEHDKREIEHLKLWVKELKKYNKEFPTIEEKIEEFMQVMRGDK